MKLSPADTNTSGPDDGSVMMRRRDKRRHLSSMAIDIRDPYSLLSLAVRFDESAQDESLLQVPLETASIYNQDQRSFAKALQNLQRMTAPLRSASKLRQTANTTGTATSARHTPDSTKSAALTPVILSGLLATIHQQNDASNESIPSSSELVAYCQSSRHAALARVRLRNRRRRIRRTVMPALFFLGFTVLCYSTWRNLRQILIDFAFVDDCTLPSPIPASCRLHSVPLYRNAVFRRDELKDCTIQSCPIQSDYPSYALHTHVRREVIPLDEIGEPSKRPRRGHSRSHSDRRPATRTHLSPLQWLGETYVNRLVRETLLDMWPSNSAIKLLDVGCGVGGTLYALLGAQPHKMSYQGIAIAASEVREARRLAGMHRLEEPPDNMAIRFQQKDFDEPMEETYNTMVAIDSLSYSPNITTTINNLAASMQSKGLLVIVDDIISNSAPTLPVETMQHLTMRPSLLTNKQWIDTLESAGFEVKNVRDLGMEMGLPDLATPPQDLWNFLSTWRNRTAEFVLRRWLKYGDDPSMHQKAALRAVQLVQDLVQKTRGSAHRQRGYLKADLLYHLYVSVKQ